MSWVDAEKRTLNRGVSLAVKAHVLCLALSFVKNTMITAFPTAQMCYRRYSMRVSMIFFLEVPAPPVYPSNVLTPTILKKTQILNILQVRSYS